MSAQPPDLDRLFAAPPKAFVAERKLLADRLKASGQLKEAKEVGQTPRPSVSAWVVNQLARQEAPLLQRLAEMTVRLRGVQRRAAERVDDAAEALAEHRDALKRLRVRAEEILVASGQAARPQILERVVRNLRVGLASDETRRTIESGRLVQDVSEEDFVSLLGPPSELGDHADRPEPKATGEPSGGPAKIGSFAADRPARRAQVDESREAAARAAEAAKARARAEAERVRARAAAERRIRTLRGEAEAARRTLEKEERACAAARNALAEAEDRLRQIRLASEQAGQALEAAEAALADHP